MSQSIIYIISILKNEMKWCGCKSGLNMNVKILRKPSSVGVERVVQTGCRCGGMFLHSWAPVINMINNKAVQYMQ